MLLVPDYDYRFMSFSVKNDADVSLTQVSQLNAMQQCYTLEQTERVCAKKKLKGSTEYPESSHLFHELLGVHDRSESSLSFSLDSSNG